MINVLANIKGLNQKETEKMTYDSFHMGLGEYTSLEIVRQVKEIENVKEILEYLQRIENHLMTKQKLNSKVSEKCYSPETVAGQKKFEAHKLTSINLNKWCKIHKTASHRTRDCFLNNKNKGDPKYKQKQEKASKTMILTESANNEPCAIKIQCKVEDKNFDIIIDSGSDHNFIRKDIALQLDSKIMDTKPLNVLFAGGQGAKVTKNISTGLKINGKIYKVKFYILPKMPVKLILGTEFLLSESCIIDYNKMLLVINKQNMVPIINNQKTTDELIDERLFEKISLMMKYKVDLDLNKKLKYYF